MCENSFNVSVIIAIYNAAPFIEKAVKSALELDEVKEIIIVEDGSTDDSLQVCELLNSKYSVVKLFHHKNHSNKGAPISWNLGISKATYEYIAILGADDYFLPNRFKIDKNIFELNLNADAVYGAMSSFFYSEKIDEVIKKKFEKLTTVNYKCSPEEVVYGLLNLYKNDFGNFSLNSLTLKRESLSKLDYIFDEELRLHQDSEFILRATINLKFFAGSIDEAISVRGVHFENRITANKEYSEKFIKNKLLFWSKIRNWKNFNSLSNTIKNKIILSYWAYYNYNNKPFLSKLFFKFISLIEILKKKDYKKIYFFITKTIYK